MIRPQLVTEAEMAAALHPLYERRTHWFFCVPMPPAAAALGTARIGPHVPRGDFLALLPLAGTGLTALVLVVGKAANRPRPLLDALGYDGFDADRLEESMAARDVVVMTDDQDLALTVAEALAPVLDGTPPAPPPRRPRLQLLRRFRRRRPAVVEFALRHGRGQLTVTMGEGQWDGTLQAAYDAGALLVELDGQKKVVAVYCNGGG
jgi:hypothetical protein